MLDIIPLDVSPFDLNVHSAIGQGLDCDGGPGPSLVEGHSGTTLADTAPATNTIGDPSSTLLDGQKITLFSSNALPTHQNDVFVTELSIGGNGFLASHTAEPTFWSPEFQQSMDVTAGELCKSVLQGQQLGESGVTESGTQQLGESGVTESGTQQLGESGVTESGTQQLGESGVTESGTQQLGESGVTESGTQQLGESGVTQSGRVFGECVVDEEQLALLCNSVHHSSGLHGPQQVLVSEMCVGGEGMLAPQTSKGEGGDGRGEVAAWLSTEEAKKQKVSRVRPGYAHALLSCHAMTFATLQAVTKGGDFAEWQQDSVEAASSVTPLGGFVLDKYVFPVQAEDDDKLFVY